MVDLPSIIAVFALAANLLQLCCDVLHHISPLLVGVLESGHGHRIVVGDVREVALGVPSSLGVGQKRAGDSLWHFAAVLGGGIVLADSSFLVQRYERLGASGDVSSHNKVDQQSQEGDLVQNCGRHAPVKLKDSALLQLQMHTHLLFEITSLKSFPTNRGQSLSEDYLVKWAKIPDP